ncbi:MAG TPA: dihydrodipicolinate synthase family protein [Niabella sp.]|nr:dihydrodipicolinate synthase family protein [Chitinophagaceae bacterium]HRN46402.1 dihydrodipicolinate synthase family protein [Niabella sp.]HRO83522.1 dihydrodipicolinate synthase family protein [Niabella sp.]HUN02020.1 dihydrodipicolinate synthase family protein [Niabella sp.]
MMDNKKFVPVMITPFNLKAEIDYDAVSELVEFYLKAGVSGFFANCLSSEMFSLSEDERLKLTKHVVERVNGKVPIVATGSFGLTLEDKADFTKRIYDIGVDAVIMIAGHFAKVDEGNDALLRNFEKILSLTDNIPLGMYECPSPYKRIVEPEVFKKLLEFERFIYHKDTSITHENVKGKLDVLQKTKSKLEFYDAHTPNASFSIQNGATGMSSISGNFYPEVLVWMVNNANNPEKREEVDWLQSELTRVDPTIHIAYPISAKYFLAKRGLSVRNISRAYSMHLTPEQKEDMDAIHKDFLKWCERLEIEPVKL